MDVEIFLKIHLTLGKHVPGEHFRCLQYRHLKA